MSEEELPVRRLTEARIRELLDGMPDFYEKLRKKDRKTGGKPLPLPKAEDYPAVGSLADAMAPSFYDDPDEMAFYRDMMRLQDLWGFTQGRIKPARAAIDAALATLRQQDVVIVSDDPDVDVAELYSAEMAELHSIMFGSRIAQLESVTDEELSAVERFASQIGPKLMGSMKASASVRRARSGNGGPKRKHK